jgi:hypothetical protein
VVLVLEDPVDCTHTHTARHSMSQHVTTDPAHSQRHSQRHSTTAGAQDT